MPITVKDYSWDETEKTVHVTVPLKGVKPSKADIFSTDEYLKVNYPPYLFEVVLFQPVDDGKSTAQVGGGAVVFSLQKKEPGVWSRLTSTQSDDKELMKSKRQQAVEAAHKKAEREREEEAIEKRERERYALKEQMRIEEEERKRIEDTKEAERRKATEDIEQWKEEKLQQEQEIITHTTQPTDPSSIFSNDSLPGIRNSQTGNGETQKEQEDLPPAGPRSQGSIEVTFTPRVFPTPLRESRIKEEEEWLKKQAEARKSVDIDDPDLTEEEKNPQWLKEKGDGFFKSGNFLAAINAYNMAARLNGKLPSVYSNRSACHLKQRNFMKCIEDSSKALELLTPPVPANQGSRIRCHVRRGTAFCELELYAEGLQDYEAALKLDPKNDKLRADAERIRRVIQGSVPDLD